MDTSDGASFIITALADSPSSRPSRFVTFPCSSTVKVMVSVFLVKPSGGVISSRVYVPAGRSVSSTLPFVPSDVQLMVLPSFAMPSVDLSP